MTAALVHAVALYGAAALVLLTVPVLCWIAAHGEPADVHLSDWP